MKLNITYTNGAAFEVEADNEEDFTLLLNTAQKILWGRNAKSMTLDEAAAWLGWK